MLILLQFLCVFLAGTSADSTVYDQRQSGKTNVRVEVKDAVIIAVGDAEFGGDYDYSYDYSDLTIKPIQPISSTKKPTTTETTAISSQTSNTTETPQKNTTFQAPISTAAPNISLNHLILEPENSTIIFPANTQNDSSEPLKVPPNQIPVMVVQDFLSANRPNKFLPVKTMNKQYVSSSQLRSQPPLSSRINTEMLPTRHCAPGFFLDNHNRCKRIARPSRERTFLPIGFRLDRKL